MSALTLKKGALPRDDDGSRPTFESLITRGAEWTKSLPTAPEQVNRQIGAKFQMYLNDQLGDCTVADMFNLFTAVSNAALNVSGGIQFTNAEALKVYSDPSVGNYQGTPATDQGSTLEKVCTYGQKTGFVDANGKLHKVAGWAEVENFTDLGLLKQIAFVFGAVYLGVSVGDADMNATNEGKPWTLNKRGANVGPDGIDHCVSMIYSAYGDNAVLYDEHVATWGMAQAMSINWAETNIGQAVVVVTEDWLEANGTSVSGFDLQQLLALDSGH